MTTISQSDTNGGTQQGGDTELDEFDLAMDEALALTTDTEAGAGEGDGGDPVPDSDEVGTQPASDDEARPDQPVGGDKPPAETPPTDIWANAPPELKAAHDAALGELNTKLNRTRGQLSASDRALERLRKERGTTPDGGEGQAPAGENPFDAEDLKKLEEEYGEVAGPLLKLTKGLYERVNRLEAPVAEVAQQRDADARTSQLSIFTTAHPDWEEYVTDERYPDWLSKQPKAVQDAAQRAVNVEDGEEAAWLLGQFKAHIGTGTAKADPEPAPNPKPSNQQSAADLRRSRQLAAGRDGGTSAPPAQSGIPDDFDGAIDAILAAKDRQRTRQGRFQ